MKIKTLFLVCVIFGLFCLNVFAQERTNALNPDEEIKKYEIRGVMDGETPSISMYYEGKQLGWMTPGQKKGNCLLKAYDKETKEVILEIARKEYRLREGVRVVADFENENVALYFNEVQGTSTKILRVYWKKSDQIPTIDLLEDEVTHIPIFNGKFQEEALTKGVELEIIIYGADKLDFDGDEVLDLRKEQKVIEILGPPSSSVTFKAG